MIRVSLPFWDFVVTLACTAGLSTLVGFVVGALSWRRWRK